MQRKPALSFILTTALTCAVIAGPLADNSDDWAPLSKKQLPSQTTKGGNYTMQGTDLMEDAPEITVGGPYTGTTVDYTDDYDEACPYTGSTSPDVVYKFVTEYVGSYNFDLCESGYDTKIYLYAADGTTLEGCNDDACPGYRSYLTIPDLPAGDHYIVIDGYGSTSGDYTLYIEGVAGCQPVECPGGIDEVEPNGGCNEEPDPIFQEIVCGDVICGSAWVDIDNPEAQRDTDWYLLEVTEPQILNISLELDEIDMVIYLIDEVGAPCEFEIIGTADEAGYCENENLISCCLDPGTYYIFVAGNTFYEVWAGNYVLTVDCTYCGDDSAGDNCEDPILVDVLPYFDDGNSSEYMDDGFNASPDVFYQFTTTVDQAITVSLCENSAYDTYLWLLSDDCATVYAQNDDACGLVSEIVDPCLPAGTYYAVVEGYSSHAGYYTIDIIPGEECGDEPSEGDNCEMPFEIPGFPYTDSGNSCDFFDDGFNPSSDVFYHFNMEVEADLTISLCDGSSYDTYLRLLAEDCSTEIFSNDDYCGAVSQLDMECLPPGEYYIVVEGYSLSCGEYVLNVSLGEDCLTGVDPNSFALRDNYPNPFNPTTTIEFTLAEPGYASLSVYSVTGELVSTLISGNLAAGHQSVVFNASSLPSGVYFYTLRAGSFSETRKMVLVK